MKKINQHILFVALALLGVVLLMPFSFAEATTAPTVRSVTPSAPHVVYIMFKPGAAHLQKTAHGLGMNFTTGQKASAYEQVLRSIEVTSISSFNPTSKDDSISHVCGIDRMFVVTFSNEFTPIEAASMFLASGEIQAASPRYLFPLAKTPNDPQINQQYALSKMKMFNAWDVTTGDTSIVIADIDEGTNYNHEDLAGNVKFNSGEVGLDSKGRDKRFNGIDDDGDGVTDNWRGVNIVGTGTATNFMPTGDPIPGAANLNHGTLTAGCAVAVGNNQLGIAGTAYSCKVIIIRADDGQGHIAGGYEGLDYAARHGARIINCSWGGPIDKAAYAFLQPLVDEVTAHNGLIVAASGNNGLNIDDSSFAPASLPGVLAVGATDQDDKPAGFTNYGNRVNVYAPGVAVLSTTWPGNDQYSNADGTSFSSPLVAGVAALVMGLHPTWPPKFVAQQIINTCDNVVKPTDRIHYWGRVNAQAAVAPATFPGLLILNHTVAGTANGFIDTVGTVTTVTASFKNFVGNGQNLTVDLLTPGGVTVDQPHQVIGSMNTGDTRQLTFTVRRTAQYSSGTLPLYFAIGDGASYKDTLVISVPMQTQQGLLFIDSVNGYCTGVKQINSSTGWLVNGSDDGTTVFSGFEFEIDTSWSFGGNVGDGTAPAWCVDATDGLTAWVGTASLSGKAHPKVSWTVDAGGTWTPVDVSLITPYVNSIHFTDPMNGRFFGDPRGGNWGIGVTTDGGHTWKASNTPIAALTGEVGWKNSICWVRKNGWFGTNKGEIYRTTDGGVRWAAHPIPAANCVGIGFDDDSLNGFAVCRTISKTTAGIPSGANGFFRTVDGGATWSAATVPGTNGIASDVKFVPGLDIAYVLTNQGVYKTTDFGSHWTLVGAPITWAASNGYLSIGSDARHYTATAVSPYGSVSVGGVVPPKQAVGSAQATEATELFQNAPNPFADRTTLSYANAKREHISIDLYDAVGRHVESIVNEVIDPGMHTASLTVGRLPSGVYEYVLATGSGVRLVRRLSIIR